MINYKSLPRKNPQDLVAPEKFYASVVPNGSADFESLAMQIANQCTLTEADCIAVLTALEKNVIQELREGKIVRLGKLGNFQISFSSSAFDSADEVTANGITQRRILFRPSKNMRTLLQTLSFKKAG